MRCAMEQEGQVLMIGMQSGAKLGRLAQRRWIGAALICLTAVLCLGVGLGVAAAKKQKAGAAAAKPSAKAKAASKGNGSLARAKAAARAKARAGARGRRGVTAASANMPPSPPARDYFGKQTNPAPLAARSIGSYVRGCLAGGKMLPVNGPAWQAMRLSRNRNWGHPLLVSYVEKLAADAQKLDKWPGLLVGDLAQPMGGPMISGHASHQIGLDADIWLKPMPPKTLTNEERENISAESVIMANQLAINPEVWQPGHVQLLKRAASYPNVARIFVHPAIKKALCEAAGTDRGWLSKVRPWWGHHYHFHVRLSCPPGAEGCDGQPPAGSDDGCGKEVESWLKRLKTPIIQKVPPVQKAPITMAQLPAECSKLVGYEPPPPVPLGPPLPGRKPDGIKTAVTPVSAPPVKPAR